MENIFIVKSVVLLRMVWNRKCVEIIWRNSRVQKYRGDHGFDWTHYL